MTHLTGHAWGQKIIKFSASPKLRCMQLKGEIKTDGKSLESMHPKFVWEQWWVNTIPLLLIPNSHISLEVTLSLGQRETVLLLFASQRYNLHKTEKAWGCLTLSFILPKTASSKELRLEKHSGTDMQMRAPGFTLGSFTFLWSENVLLWKQCWKIVRDISVMSTICIPLLFSQKTQDLKPHNMLNNRSQIFSSFLSSCSHSSW